MLSDADRAILADTHLLVLLEGGATLRQYDEIGLLERELAIFRRVRPHLRALTLITWSKGGDAAYRDQLGDIGLHFNTAGMRARLWQAAFWYGARRLFPGRCVLRTNQTFGGDFAVRVARRAGWPLIARCGYPLSTFTAREHGRESRRARWARGLERRLFTASTRVQVTTPEIADLARQYGVPDERIAVVPNYVDTDLFRPSPERRPPFTGAGPARLLCIGRMEAQKNIATLIEALADLPVVLDLVGRGSLENELRSVAATQGVEVRFHGNVPHGDLPGLMNVADAFVLPSHFEGHPKALLEAMAAGLPCIGADVPGIREVVTHGVDGTLVAPTAKTLRGAVVGLMADAEAAAALGRAARRRITGTVSLDRVAARDLSVIAAAAPRGDEVSP